MLEKNLSVIYQYTAVCLCQQIIVDILSIWTIISACNTSHSEQSGQSCVGHPCTQIILCYIKYSVVQKLSNKQSAKVICRLDRLKAAHRKNKKAIQVMEYLSVAPAFDYIVLRINFGLTTLKDNSLENIISVCNASYILPYIARYMPGIINLCFYYSHAYYHIAIFMQSAYKK